MTNNPFFLVGLSTIFWIFSNLIGISEGAISNKKGMNNPKFISAIENVSKAIDSGDLRKKELSVAFQYRGILYSGLYILDSAIKDLEKSIVIDPNNADAYVDLGIVFSKLEEYDKAITYYDKAIKLNNKNNFAYKNKGYALYYTSKYDEALRMFKQCLRIDPNDKYRYLWEYMASVRSGRNGKINLKKRIEITLKNQWPTNLCKLFLDKIEPEDVMKNMSMQVAMTENQLKCEAFFFIGQFFLMKGNKSSALKFFQKAVNTDVKEFIEWGFARKELRLLSKKR